MDGSSPQERGVARPPRSRSSTGRKTNPARPHRRPRKERPNSPIPSPLRRMPLGCHHHHTPWASYGSRVGVPRQHSAAERSMAEAVRGSHQRESSVSEGSELWVMEQSLNLRAVPDGLRIRIPRLAESRKHRSPPLQRGHSLHEAAQTYS